MTVLSKTELVPGTTYHAVISGSIRVEYPGNAAYELHDPFYCYETDWKTGESPGHCLGNKATQENVAVGVHEGVGTAGCVGPIACELPLGAVNAQCCKPIPFESSHRYENDFQVDYPGRLRVNADKLCPAVNTAVKCISGSFSVTITEAAGGGCRAPSGVGAERPKPPFTVRFSVQQKRVPRRGESPTLVSTATGGQGKLTFCDAGGQASEGSGTILHVDDHRLVPGGPERSERIALRIDSGSYFPHGTEKRMTVAGTVIKSTDPGCPEGARGGLILIDKSDVNGTPPPGKEDKLIVEICGKQHEHVFQDGGPAKPIGDVVVTVKIRVAQN
jgi:hypothetical protein